MDDQKRHQAKDYPEEQLQATAKKNRDDDQLEDTRKRARSTQDGKDDSAGRSKLVKRVAQASGRPETPLSEQKRPASQPSLPVLAPYPTDNKAKEAERGYHGRSLLRQEGAFPKCLSIPDDKSSLSSYQRFVRKQLEFFLATSDDIAAVSKGRPKPVVGQIGVRCCHCAHLRASDRAQGSTSFPSTLLGIYHSVQRLCKDHLVLHCPFVPAGIVEELLRLGHLKPTMKQGGRSYWANGAKILGVTEKNGHLAALNAG